MRGFARVAERGAQPPAVEGAAGDEVGVAGGLRVEAGALGGVSGASGVGAAEGPAWSAWVVCSARRRRKCWPALDGEAEAVGALGDGGLASGWRSTGVSSGTSRVERGRRRAGCWAGSARARSGSIGATRPRQRATIGVPASSPWNSPTCHWRASSQSGSCDAGGEAGSAMSRPDGVCGSMRDQVVIEGIGVLRILAARAG